MTAPYPNIELEIKELVLHGFPPGDRDRIGGAVERELTRLLAEKGLPTTLTASSAVANLDGGLFTIASSTRPEAIGGSVARAIYGGFGR